jgi:hypothetical protein
MDALGRRLSPFVGPRFDTELMDLNVPIARAGEGFKQSA